MAQPFANTGEASKLNNLSGEFLGGLNVHGNGTLQIDHDFQSTRPCIRWNPGNVLEPRYQAMDTSPGPQQPSTNAQEVTRQMLETSSYSSWVAPGAPGEEGIRISGPVQFIRKLMKFWHLDDADVVALLGYELPETEYVTRELQRGRGLPGRDFKDRIAYLFHIRRTLWSLFRDIDVENEWLRENHSMLRGDSPISLLLEGSIESLLLVVEYVESAAGVR